MRSALSQPFLPKSDNESILPFLRLSPIRARPAAKSFLTAEAGAFASVAIGPCTPIDDVTRTVVVYEVGHRREVYR